MSGSRWRAARSGRFLGLLAFVGLCVGCAEDPQTDCLNGQFGLDCVASLEVFDGAGKNLGDGDIVRWQAGGGEAVERTFEIANTISSVTAAALHIRSIKVVSVTGDGATFSCRNEAGQPCAGATWRPVVPAGTSIEGAVQRERFRIRWQGQAGSIDAAAVEIRVSGEPAYVDEPFKFVVRVDANVPRIKLTPAVVDFGWHPVGESKTRVVLARNTGDAPLRITGMRVKGDAGFALRDEATHVFHPAGTDVPMDAAMVLQPGGSRSLTVRYTAASEAARQAELLVDSDAFNDGAGRAILTANADAPCIDVAPKLIDFGAVLVGKSAERAFTITNCGGGDLLIKAAALTKGGQEFALLGTGVALPAALDINGSRTFRVLYQPEDVTGVDKDTGMPALDHATVTVTTGYGPRDVAIRGFGVDKTCPIAKIHIAEGEEVIPQTTLHLDGKQSVAVAGGAISHWQWSLVKQPPGSTAQLLPSANDPAPQLTANVAGSYRICLSVADNGGHKSCIPACADVIVVPSDAIHVELLWHNPADPDESDTGPGAGADVDLHFTHPMASNSGYDLDCDGAPDPWFSVPFDTFWFNAKPNWASAASTKDDPRLDLDDTDGAGPENLNLDEPQGTVATPIAYDVGVHYWDDHGYGLAEAEVRLYINGALIWSDGPVPLKPLDMWHVGRVRWPNKLTTGVGEPFVQCHQSAPLASPKGVCKAEKASKKWAPSGQRCMTSCYKPKAFGPTPKTAPHCS